jgi:hypothetical protein
MFRVRLVLIGMVSVAFLAALLFQRLETVCGGTHPANDNAQRTPVLVELLVHSFSSNS